MAKGEGESSIAPFAGDTFALRLAHWQEWKNQEDQPSTQHAR